MTKAKTLNRDRGSKRALLNRLWAEGRSYEEIARAMEWSEQTPPQTMIAIYRKRKGYVLPPRQDPEITRAQKAARWPGR